MGEIFVDFFAKPPQGAMFRQFRDMIEGIPNSLLDAHMSCPGAMANVTSYECACQNDKQK